jgi:hypothetical protein
LTPHSFGKIIMETPPIAPSASCKDFHTFSFQNSTRRQSFHKQ